MANLIETPEWTAGIYQLEQDDLVLGGPDGIDNVQAKQLSNRTSWLKQQVESAQGEMATHVAAADPHPQYATDVDLAAAIAALVNSSPATLDTLAEIATALSNDPNFATTIMNALALKAPLASPALTGAPTAPTQAKFDNSTKVATTEFVNAKGLQSSGETFVSTSAALTAAVAGGTVIFSNASAIAPVLPAASELPAGGRIQFFNVNTGIVTLARAGTDIIAMSNATVSTISLGLGDTLTVESNGANGWNVVAGSVQLGSSAAFGSSLSASGYQKLPSGLIIQWGTFTPSAGTGAVTTAVTFPLAFPNQCYSVTTGSGGSGDFDGAVVPSITGFSVTTYDRVTTSTVDVSAHFYMAIGR